MADPKTEDHADEMAEQLDTLDGHIDDARKKLQGRKEAAGIDQDVAGDWEGEQDRGQGDDPSGAHDDAAQGAPGGSQDGPGAEGDKSEDDAGAGAGDGAKDDDEPVEEEYASPT